MLRSEDVSCGAPGTNETAAPEEGLPFERVGGKLENGLLLLCDHARPDLPTKYGSLGLSADQFERHIAYDIGARGVTLALAEALDIPAVLSCFSRLLIDPNRGIDDPTLVMRIADGSIVPGNAHVGREEIDRRIERYHEPYHRAIDTAIDEAVAAGTPPAILSIHSFTPRFQGRDRPWHATILWDSDPRMARPMLEELEKEPDLVTGENVPYSGELRGDTLFFHGTGRGLAHALIEIRQDLIADAAGIAEWSARLARILGALEGTPGLNEIQSHESRAR